MTSHPCFDWTRFWALRESTFSLDGRGFLADPESSDWMNPGAVSLYGLAECSCLVLLGQPGIGKSAEIRQAQVVAGRAGGRVLSLDLKEYRDESRLIRELFESPDFEEWRTGKGELLLFLDSLDECLLRIDTVANLLARRLARYDAGRLRLRIACRPAVWPSTLEQALREIWGKDKVRVMELLPLRRRDIVRAAEASGLHAQQFLQAIESRGAVPFAIKPLTLQFLLDKFRRGQILSASPLDLYLEGCRWLCEPGDNRAEAGLPGKLSPEQRLAVARRIAALTVLCGRNAIYHGGSPGGAEDGDLLIREIAGGQESEGRQTVEVSEEAIRETLDTGLFSSRGPSRLGWAHQSYAEFLAARYLTEHRFEITQKLSLVTHSGDLKAVVPQLSETAGWLAALDPAFAEQLLADNPQVLLRTDVPASEEFRGQLTSSLLQIFDEQRLTDASSDLRRSYTKLDHPGLAAQLEPYIRGRERNAVVRRVAIEIAEACGKKDLQRALVDVSLDSQDFAPTRMKAITALGRVGDSASKALLKPLLLLPAAEDSDEVKGAVLDMLWPGLLDGAELFGCLTAPQVRKPTGHYFAFLSKKLTPGLEISDFPAALAWVAREASHFPAALSYWQKVFPQIAQKAWRHLEDPVVLRSFARLMLVPQGTREFLIEDGPPRRYLPLVDPEKRRQVIAAAVESGATPDQIFSGPIGRFLVREDLSWFLGRLESEPRPDLQGVWAHLVRRVFLPETAGNVDATLIMAQRIPVLEQVMSQWVTSIALDSPQAKTLREMYRSSSQVQAARDERPLPSTGPALERQIENLIERVEKGDLDAWWRLDWKISHGLQGDRVEIESDPDLRKFPVWQNLDDDLRQRARQAAALYLVDRVGPRPGPSSVDEDWPRLASYRALRLLAADDCGRLEGFSAEIWAKWAPVILDPAATLVEVKDEKHLLLLHHTLRQAPQEFLAILSEALAEADVKGEVTPNLAFVENCWDDRIAQVFFKKLLFPTLSVPLLSYVLDRLLEHGSSQARAWAETALDRLSVEREDEKARVIQIGASLLSHPSAGSWVNVWNRITTDPKLGREIVSVIASNFENRRQDLFASRLSDGQVADLYIWLVEQFPPSTDPQHRDLIHRVDFRDWIAYFRDGILSQLRHRSTQESYAVLQRITNAFPEDRHLPWLLADARQAMLARTWLPPEPSQILEMAASAGSRLVQSSEQLLELVMDSLRRLEKELHDHGSLVDTLWIPSKSGSRPRDEAALSNLVKRHLKKDLQERAIGAHREVEVRPPQKGARQGEEVDILVEAFSIPVPNRPVERFSVLVEVKGCWNRNLKTDMKEQLVDRYLEESESRHGIYLVGWFRCGIWTGGPAWSLEEARSFFELQAKGLSSGTLTVRALVLDTALR